MRVCIATGPTIVANSIRRAVRPSLRCVLCATTVTVPGRFGAQRGAAARGQDDDRSAVNTDRSCEVRTPRRGVY